MSFEGTSPFFGHAAKIADVDQHRRLPDDEATVHVSGQ
jgi:hypothetical protein